MTHLLPPFTWRCRTRSSGRSCGGKTNVSVICVPYSSASNIAINECVSVRRSLCLDERYRSHDLQSGCHHETAVGKGYCMITTERLSIGDVPAGLVAGCKKVKELVPRVRLARFHRESLPSRLGLPGGGDVEWGASSDGGL